LSISNTSLFWFRNDLRIKDNPGFYNIINDNKNNKNEIILLYIYDNNAHTQDKDNNKTNAQHWWLRNAILDLEKNLAELGAKLIIKSGDPNNILDSLINDHNINTIYLNQGLDPNKRKQEEHLLNKKNIDIKIFSANFLSDPEKMVKDDGKNYQVFTPYWRNLLKKNIVREPVKTPIINGVKFNKKISSEKTEDLIILKKWSDKFTRYWDPTEKGANNNLKHFLEKNVFKYKYYRDFPETQGTSLLSPYIHFGQISIVTIWHEAQKKKEICPNEDFECFLSELGWREFSYYLIYYFPDLPNKNFKNKFDDFTWENSKKNFNAWSTGNTGFPIIDAGMRELYETGYMHNRVRMITASFLTKHCLTHWKIGAKWFSYTLLDCDIASNNAGWQWVAGTGADAAPYFRIFNPIRQSEKFDKNGEYIKKWVPELKNLPSKYIHAPHLAPDKTLKEFGVKLGENYPDHILDLDERRILSIKTYKNI
jgi:deoxyribodipyrimidine photo-lyase